MQLDRAITVGIPLIIGLSITISRIWFLQHHYEENDTVPPTDFDFIEVDPPLGLPYLSIGIHFLRICILLSTYLYTDLTYMLPVLDEFQVQLIADELTMLERVTVAVATHFSNFIEAFGESYPDQGGMNTELYSVQEDLRRINFNMADLRIDVINRLSNFKNG